MSNQGNKSSPKLQQGGLLFNQQLIVSFSYCYHQSRFPRVTSSRWFVFTLSREPLAWVTNFLPRSDLLTLINYLNSML